MENTFEYITNIMPKTVKIGGIDYTVKLYDSHSFLGGANFTDCLDGEFDVCKKQIRLATKQKDNNEELIDKDRLLTVFLHEIIHGIFYHYLEDYTENEEHLVTQIAKGLYQVMKENKELIELIVTDGLSINTILDKNHDDKS